MSQGLSNPTTVLTDTRQRALSTNLDGDQNRLEVEDLPLVSALSDMSEKLDRIIQLLETILG
jgi:hypothetical protein